jgi:hypothetical protein
LAENLGESGDQPPPPPPVPPPDQRTPQASRELKDAYRQETTGTQRAETDGDPVRAATRDASSPSLMHKIYLTLAALIMVLASHAEDEAPSPQFNPDRQGYVSPAKDHVSLQGYVSPANDKVPPQEYVSPANDKVPPDDRPDLVKILGETEKVVSAIGEDLKDKADALDDEAARLAADRNQNASGIRREDLDRPQDEGK